VIVGGEFAEERIFFARGPSGAVTAWNINLPRFVL
jgi:hypothetical protein